MHFGACTNRRARYIRHRWILTPTAGKEPLAMLAADRSAVIVNTHEEMPPAFIRERDFLGEVLESCW